MRITFHGGRESAKNTVDYLLDSDNAHDKTVTFLGGRYIDISKPLAEDKQECARNITKSFDIQSTMRPGITKPLVHLSIAWLPREKVTDATMLIVANRVLERLGLEDAQCLIVRHSEKHHQHCHLLVNLIDSEGKYLHLPHPLWYIFREISIDMNLKFKFDRGQYRAIAKPLTPTIKISNREIAKSIIVQTVFAAMCNISQFNELPAVTARLSNGKVKAEIITKTSRKTGLPYHRMQYRCKMENGKEYTFRDRNANWRIGYEQLIYAFHNHVSIEQLIKDSGSTFMRFGAEKEHYYFKEDYLETQRWLQEELESCYDDVKIAIAQFTDEKQRQMYLTLLHGEYLEYFNEKLLQGMYSKALERERRLKRFKMDTPKTAKRKI